MQIGEPLPDPFAGMNPVERKRAQETAILEMAYDPSRFHWAVPSERPEFRLTPSENDPPFGVDHATLPERVHDAPERCTRHGYYHRRCCVARSRAMLRRELGPVLVRWRV